MKSKSKKYRYSNGYVAEVMLTPDQGYKASVWHSQCLNCVSINVKDADKNIMKSFLNYIKSLPSPGKE
jgi:hypothetical protein